MKKIGILGSGIVAQTLGSGLMKEGVSVIFGTNHPEKLSDFKEKNPDALIGNFSEAAGEGEMLLLCVKGTAAEEVVKSLPEVSIKGKTIMDTTNPIADKAPQNGVLNYFTSHDESLLERLQSIAPQANFVKAFNSVGNSLMVHPDLEGVVPTMFICGNDAGAKEDVSGIVELLGWEVEDMGVAAAARAIEPLCILWCIPGFLRNDWSHAFKLLKK